MNIKMQSVNLSKTNKCLCSICLSKVLDPIKLNCNHVFCHKCIYDWYCACNSKKIQMTLI